jgi:flagellar hook-basal body complex protein FliE
MAIAPIPAGATPIPPVTAPRAAQAAKGAGKIDFAAGLEQVQKLTQQADQLGTQVATGKLENIHDFMAASAKANLAIELTASVRNRAVEAYQEIMRMQV